MPSSTRLRARRRRAAGPRLRTVRAPARLAAMSSWANHHSSSRRRRLRSEVATGGVRPPAQEGRNSPTRSPPAHSKTGAGGHGPRPSWPTHRAARASSWGHGSTTANRLTPAHNLPRSAFREAEIRSHPTGNDPEHQWQLRAQFDCRTDRTRLAHSPNRSLAATVCPLHSSTAGSLAGRSGGALPARAELLNRHAEFDPQTRQLSSQRGPERSSAVTLRG